MPRSVNPHSYAAIYWDLLEAMSNDVPELKLDMPANTAQKFRFNFYAFIRALDHQAERAASAANLAVAAQREEEANTMRGYIAAIYIDDVKFLKVKKHDARIASLKFINRDLDPETLDAHAQLKAQMRNLPQKQAVNQVVDNIKLAPVTSFFTTPLEITDDIGDPGDPSEESAA